MTPTLRQAGPADAAAISRLTMAAYEKWVARLRRQPRPMTVDYAQAIHDHRFDVTPAAGQIVATIETTPEDGWLLIVNIAVAETAQRQGLAGFLIDHAETLAREGGFKGLRLYANALMTENLAFYARRGFVLGRIEPFPGGEIVHMERPLPS
jgi:GNAT superfamily N-acetyltransferase